MFQLAYTSTRFFLSLVVINLNNEFLAFFMKNFLFLFKHFSCMIVIISDKDVSMFRHTILDIKILFNEFYSKLINLHCIDIFVIK